jgi:ABC-type Fe3+-siderophore transport system permease subunit
MDEKVNVRDLIAYVTLWIASFILYFWAIPTQIILRNFVWIQDVAFDGRTLPRLIAIGLFITSSMGIVKTLPQVLKARRTAIASGEQAAEDAGSNMSLYARIIPLLIFLVCVLYVVLFSNFGFIIASAIAMPIMLALYKTTKWYYYLIAYAFAGVLFVVFRIVLRVPIPY